MNLKFLVRNEHVCNLLTLFSISLSLSLPPDDQNDGHRRDSLYSLLAPVQHFSSK